MIVFLLLVIVAILRFGSSAVLGVIGWILGLIVAIIAISQALAFWETLSVLGKTLVIASPVIAAALLFAAVVLVSALTDHSQPITLAPPPPQSKIKYPPHSESEPKKAKAIRSETADRVWGWYSVDVKKRFGKEARTEAERLYAAGDANKLDRFCRSEIARLNDEA